MRLRTLRVPRFETVPGLSRFLEDFLASMNRTNDDQLSKTEANHSLLLQAPDESVWEVTVNNAGVLTAAKIAG